MIRQALSFLFPRKPTLAERLEAERDQARKAYLDALMRGDTRDQFWAHRDYVRATNACLRVEGMQ